MRVLLLVDIQNDFCPGGALAVSEGDCVVGPANELMESGQYDLVIASRDWHPPSHGSFASNHPGKALFEVVDLNGLPQCLWPNHCEQNSPGAELHPDLRQDLIDYVVFKGTDEKVDSYSAFFDNGRRNSTRLHEFIMERARSVGCLNPGEVQIDVCGLATDYCVKFSALDAAELGYQTALVIDACRAVNVNPGDDLRALDEMVAKGVKLQRSMDIVLPKVREVGVERGMEA